MSDPEHHDHALVDVWEDEGGDNDDVWGNDDEVSYDRAIAQKEWDRLHENFGNVRKDNITKPLAHILLFSA